MKPNVILFFADTLEKASIGWYGSSIPTPNMDRLAAEGLRFHAVQPNSPVCSPARYNLLTGRYASRAGMYRHLYTERDPVMQRWNVYPDAEEKFTAHAFAEAGYRTGLCGKWHLGEPLLEPYIDEDHQGNQQTLAKVSRNYERCQQFVRQHGGFDYVEGLFSNNELAIPMPADMTCQHHMHWISDHAVWFIQDSGEAPYFLTVTPNVPHHPHVLDTLESNSKLTPSGFLAENPRIQPDFAHILQRLDDLGFEKNPEKYSAAWLAKDHAAAIMWLDDGLGAILDAVDARGDADNTIIAFTTDHLARGKMTLHRQYLPLLMRWPQGLSAGQDHSELVSHVDLVATLLELAGIDDSAKAMHVGTDGKSFASVLRGETTIWEMRPYVLSGHMPDLGKRIFGD
jgi:arylsulfatase A-like enzyme